MRPHLYVAVELCRCGHREVYNVVFSGTVMLFLQGGNVPEQHDCLLRESSPIHPRQGNSAITQSCHTILTALYWDTALCRLPCWRTPTAVVSIY